MSKDTYVNQYTLMFCWWSPEKPKAYLAGNQLFIQTQIKENIKAPRHWHFVREFTADRWIPRTKGQ